jgi:hypothetical protein
MTYKYMITFNVVMAMWHDCCHDICQNDKEKKQSCIYHGQSNKYDLIVIM